ncbi:hypothetical protein HZB03_02970 [Candidatus Woesearchaeota archaeon]|nr:hypothetical protein [Candidatus Woesearchaeota archaeon]
MADTTFAPPGMGGAPPQTPAKPAGGLFAAKPRTGPNIEAALSDMAGEVNNIGRRLRVLEERYTNLRKKTQVTDQNMLAANKRMMTEIHATLASVDDLKKDLTEMHEKFAMMIREIKECAKRQDVAVLQKYISFWEPMNFVTRESVSKMVQENVDAQFHDLNIRLQQEEYIKEQIQFALRDLKKSDT